MVRQLAACTALVLLFGLTGCVSEPPIETALQRQLAAVEGAKADTIRRIYANRDGDPIWVRLDQPTAEARVLVRQLCAAGREGLDPSTYALDSIDAALRQAYVTPPGDDSLHAAHLAALERLLTTAFVRYADHLVNGRIHPETLDNNWYVDLPTSDVVATLNQALEQGVAATFDTLEAPKSGYAPLLPALNRYRAIAAEVGWPQVPDGPALAPSDQGQRVALLRERLAATGDLAAETSDAAVYNEAVEQAVLRFQRRHGLKPDGVVGTATLSALNVPVQTRIEQLAVNLERHRWLPEQLGDTRIFVHLTNFQLLAYRDGRPALDMPIIIGERGWRTPAFADTLSYVVFGPYWNVPASIAKEELLPQVKQDTSFLRRTGYELVNARGDSADTSQLSPEALENYTVRFRRVPGIQNPLGDVKFMFPNEHNIYLHDTPSDTLFTQDQRTFSHGCIRVAAPVALADFVLSDEEWPRDSIRTAMREATSRRVDVKRTIPVYIVYLTAWATEEGVVHFREDLYDYDPKLRQALGSLEPDTSACSSIREYLDTFFPSDDSS